MLRLPDGTPCLHSAASSSSLHSSTVPESLGVCVSGECVPVGCDNVLDHMSSRDACGVWCGNGSTCVSVSNTYTIPRHHTKRSKFINFVYFTCNHTRSIDALGIFKKNLIFFLSLHKMAISTMKLSPFHVARDKYKSPNFDRRKTCISQRLQRQRTSTGTTKWRRGL